MELIASYSSDELDLSIHKVSIHTQLKLSLAANAHVPETFENPNLFRAGLSGSFIGVLTVSSKVSSSLSQRCDKMTYAGTELMKVASSRVTVLRSRIAVSLGEREGGRSCPGRDTVHVEHTDKNADNNTSC
jgi:hypothetical protein